MTFVLLGIVSFVGFFVAWGMNAERTVRAGLVLAAIVLVLVGLGHYAASGVVHGRKQ